MSEPAPRWPIKATRYTCGARGCGASVMLTIIDPLSMVPIAERERMMAVGQ